ncbi:MAG: hypothetical protein KW802_00745 [Candidatus Doudnabacteria bacterium]|nr:hypothetical protein [Candidatus Doudnabacteria bacterium]
MSSNHEKIKTKVKDFYLTSRDFNGIPLENLFEYSKLEEAIFKPVLIELIKSRDIDLVYEGDIPNPHIKPFPAPSIDKQIEKINSLGIEDHIKSADENAEKITVGENTIRLFVAGIGCCVYPTPEYLRKTIDWRHYTSSPFTLRLAMGEWQLRPYFFELGILAVYRNDPRYRYNTDDVSGSLYSIQDELLMPSDQIFLKQFGFGFHKNGVRAVAALLCDLTRLSPEHQQIWKAKMLKDSHNFKLHPDYRKSILGHWPEKSSIFTAFLEEMRVINEMAKKIKGIPVLKEVFTDDSKPENFGFLILPTLREYELFCHTLDRMMADNINEDFFDGEIDVADLSEGETLEGLSGKKIRKMEIWINKKIRFSDHEPKDQMFKTFREVRRLRSKPGHALFINKWDLDFYKQQKELFKKAYTAIRVLRLILTNHRAAKTVEVPGWLFKGEIRTF